MGLYENGIIAEKDTDGVPTEWDRPEVISAMLDNMTFREGIGDILADGIVPAARKLGRDSGACAKQVKGMPLVEGASPEWLPYAKGATGRTIDCFGWMRRRLRDALEPSRVREGPE
jgi:aldehyde:ferredoxin oxidoreductase